MSESQLLAAYFVVYNMQYRLILYIENVHYLYSSLVSSPNRKETFPANSCRIFD